MVEKINIEPWVLYSTCDEDSNSELYALNISDNDSILSVTGSGCRTLSLMAMNPNSIVSIDYSAGQNYLLELKLAAIKALSYNDLLGFLGVNKCDDRWKIYLSIEKMISEEARKYFSHYKKEIEKGVVLRGRHEKFYVYILSPFLHILYGKHIKNIFKTDSIEEQRYIYHHKIRGPFWKFMFTKGFNINILKLILNNPKYEIESDINDLGKYILNTIDHSFNNHLARDSDWLSVMMNGKYINENALPHYLSRESYDSIRSARTKLKIITQDLVEYSETAEANTYTKFSLSDVTSCIANIRFNTLMSEITRIGMDDARIVYRNFFSRNCIPDSISNVMKRDNNMCDSLNKSDKAFSYKFEVATLKL